MGFSDELAGNLRRTFLTQPGRAFAVVDSARSPELVAALAACTPTPRRSLFVGAAAAALDPVAPQVFSLAGSDWLTPWSEAWGTSSGVLLTATVELDALCGHLRGNFVVTDETDQEYFFRFYDPRVLAPYLPTCQGEEAREFCGPVRSWWIEDGDQPRAIVFTWDGRRLDRKKIPLAADSRTAP